jgi:16S rRNA (cytosine1402-N4)-methyltransferase
MYDHESGEWHEPVLVAEVLHFLSPKPGKLIVDATVGTGGHAMALLARGVEVIGIDRDPEVLGVAAGRLARFGERVRLLRANFRNLSPVLAGLDVEGVDGVLFDLGVSTFQLSRPERGLSFRLSGPLDMRLDPDEPLCAADLVNRLPEKALAQIIWEYGEERHARKIARAIVRRREEAPIRTTEELARLVVRCYPPGHSRIHPATRTFQALRIVVNDELGALEEGLAAAVGLLRPKGVLCVISFHSLEDRIVKGTFRREAAAGHLVLLTKKPIRPGPEELVKNPRARSAKLRAATVSNGEG